MDIDSIKKSVKEVFQNDSSGHDYWHVIRVFCNAMKIADCEKCDKTIVALAALLHDVDDPKLFDTKDYDNARRIMGDHGISENMQNQIIDIIKEVSFRGTESISPKTIESKIVQDADRLDAMGAIGIARTFAYGGSRGKVMHDPGVLPNMDMKAYEYLENKGTSFNHFYEKLFQLKDMMNTDLAKKEAEKRDRFMHDYVEEFLSEWNID